MRFADFLRTTVLISAAAASALGAITLAGAAGASDDLVVPVAAGWWVAAGLIGLWLGRRADTSPADRLAAGQCPHPGVTARAPPRAHAAQSAVAAAAVDARRRACSASSLPQVPAIAAGFAVIWSLAWRRQSSAVTAIEERDGARFYIERTSPLQPIQLVRTPGFRTNLRELNGSAATRPARQA